MSDSPAVQAARKKMQLARLARKADADYGEYYTSQPMQVERARRAKEWRKAQQDLRNANEALQVAEITGEGLQKAKETRAIAALVVERLRPQPRSAGATVQLTGASQ